MSEVQAKETENEELDTEIVAETPEGEHAGAETASEEVEIIVEGEDKPASKAKPNGFSKRINKLNGKIDEANTATEEVTRRANALEEENRLLRLNAQQSKPATAPRDEDFDTDAEYQTAKNAWDDNRIATIATKKANEILQASQSQTTRVNTDRDLEDKVASHTERAESLNMPDYDDLEDKVMDILGKDFSRNIMTQTNNSHLIMGHLGRNIGKAEELAELLKASPIGAWTKVVELGASLRTRPKHSTTPDPETKIEPGEASNAEVGDKKLNKLREDAAKTGDMSKLMAYKKQLRATG